MPPQERKRLEGKALPGTGGSHHVHRGARVDADLLGACQRNGSDQAGRTMPSFFMRAAQD